ncbi:hypothetical protein WOC75_20815, partial [Klebsiella pneumoniae]|uniref:hypothetical protein n=6 Tax=Enterobacterales TaxID=91347 RepID=UPI0030F36AD3
NQIFLLLEFLSTPPPILGGLYVNYECCLKCRQPPVQQKYLGLSAFAPGGYGPRKRGLLLTVVSTKSNFFHFAPQYKLGACRGCTMPEYLRVMIWCGFVE